MKAGIRAVKWAGGLNKIKVSEPQAKTAIG